MAGVTPEVEVLHAFPVNPTRLWPPPRLCCRTCSPKETGATLRGRTAGDMAGVTPEVEVLHAFPVNPTRLWPPPRLCCRTCSPKETGATLRTEQVRIVYEIVLLVFGDDRFRPSSRRRGQLRGNLDGSRRRGGVPAISWASRRSDIRMDVEAAAAVAPERDKPVRCHIVAGQPFEAVAHRNRKF